MTVYVHNHFSEGEMVGENWFPNTGNLEFSFQIKPSDLNHKEVITTSLEEEIKKYPQIEDFLIQQVEELQKSGGNPIIYG